MIKRFSFELPKQTKSVQEQLNTHQSIPDPADDPMIALLRQKLIIKFQNPPKSVETVSISFSELEKALNIFIADYFLGKGFSRTCHLFADEAAITEFKIDAESLRRAALNTFEDVLRCRLRFDHDESTKLLLPPLLRILKTWTDLHEVEKHERGIQTNLVDMFSNAVSIEDKLRAIDEQIFSKTDPATTDFFRRLDYQSIHETLTKRLNSEFEQKFQNWKDLELDKIKSEIQKQYSNFYQTKVEEVAAEYAIAIQAIRERERQALAQYESMKKELEMKCENLLMNMNASKELNDKASIILHQEYESRFKSIQTESELLAKMRAELERKRNELTEKEDAIDHTIRMKVLHELESNHKDQMHKLGEIKIRENYFTEELGKVDILKKSLEGLTKENRIQEQEIFALKNDNASLAVQLSQSQKELKALESISEDKVTQLRKLEYQLDQLRKEDSFKEQQIRELKDFIFEYKRVLDDKNRQTQAMIFEYEHQIISLKRDLSCFRPTDFGFTLKSEVNPLIVQEAAFQSRDPACVVLQPEKSHLKVELKPFISKLAVDKSNFDQNFNPNSRNHESNSSKLFEATSKPIDPMTNHPIDLEPRKDSVHDFSDFESGFRESVDHQSADFKPIQSTIVQKINGQTDSKPERKITVRQESKASDSIKSKTDQFDSIIDDF